jgi:hypothetical protein
MPRVPRWRQLAHDAAYHVMSRGHNREALFADPDDTRYFLSLLDRYQQRSGFRLELGTFSRRYCHQPTCA